MAKTKDRGKYQAVSLPCEFVEIVRQHVLKSSKYQSIAEFVKESVNNQMERDKSELPSLIDPNSKGFYRIVAEVMAAVEEKKKKKKLFSNVDPKNKKYKIENNGVRI